MRLHETQDVQVRSLKYRCPSRQLSARMGEVCRHLPLSVLTPTLGQPGRGKFLVCCPLSVCLIYLHRLCRCRIPKWCVSAPDTSVGWEAFLSRLPVGIWGQSQHMRSISGSIQASSNVYRTWVFKFCTNLPKTSSKCPQGCTGNLGRSRDVVGRWSQPLTHLSNSFPWQTLKINLPGITNSF